MQDKESDGSSKKLVEIVARAICGHDIWEAWLDDAIAALTAIKEAGMVIVPMTASDDAAYSIGREADSILHITRSRNEGRTANGHAIIAAVLRAMISAGEESGG